MPAAFHQARSLGTDWLRVPTPYGPARVREAITCFGAPVANLIQVNVGTPRSAEMAAAEDAQDVVFSGSIKKPVAHKRREWPI
jgi:hypothetical protein